MFEKYIKERLKDSSYSLGDEAPVLKTDFFAVSHALSYVGKEHEDFWERMIEMEGKYG